MTIAESTAEVLSSAEIDLDHLPYSKGDWLETIGDRQLEIAQVRRCYWVTEADGRVRLYGDLWMYNNYGERVGRNSPAMGGPRTYEPHCELSEYQRIAQPDFPVELCRVPTSDTTYTLAYRSQAKVLGPRKPRKKAAVKIAVAAVVVRESDNGFDPEAEARALRLAAEHLRDAAATLESDQRAPIIARAVKLEAEAAALLAP